MKRSLILACCLALALSVLPRAARAEEVSFDFFYNSLADDGAWYNTPEYGYVWQPDIAYKTDKWRPYTDGYWAQTEDGWTWVSYENFGWATYHYGRWTRIKDLGWAWVPGYDWGPGWVSWRTNNDYVGWAPLPPKREQASQDGKDVNPEPAPEAAASISYNDVEPVEAGYTPAVDQDYDIGPQNYCFVENRNFGAPVLSEVILAPDRNFACVEDTVNVTNIYYRRDRDRVFVYNNGPDFAFLSGRSQRPIQQLRLDRRDDPVFVRDGIRGGGNPTVVRGGVLLVAAPFVSRNTVNFQQVRPARVKETLQHAEVIRGWQGVNADQQRVTALREKIKTNARTAPPAATANQEMFRRSAAAQAPAPGNGQAPREGFVAPNGPANAGPAAGLVPTGPRPALTDAERAARRDARLQERDQRSAARPNGQPPVTQQPGGVAPGQAPGTPQQAQDRAARREARQTGQQPGAPGAPNPAAEPAAGNDHEARRAARQQAKAQQAQEAQQAQQTAEQQKQERKASRQQQQQAAPQQPASQADPSQEGKQQRQQERQQQRAAAQQQASQQDAQAQQEKQQRQQERQQQRAAAQQQAPQQDAQAQQEKPQRHQERQQQRAAAEQAPAPQQSGPSQEERQQQRRQERQQQAGQQQQQATQQQAAQQQRAAQQQAAQQQRAAQQQPQAQPQQPGKGDDKKKHDAPNQ